LLEEEVDDNGLYRMTGLTGAIRYMAPEVGLQQPYNLKADVYSWSMLMWYILALEPPMGMYSQKMFIERVFSKGYRPAIKETWPEELSDLMRSCWSEHIDERPSFKEVMKVLKAELSTLDPHVASLVGDSSVDGS
jgi:serine/threonine protein kinase